MKFMERPNTNNKAAGQHQRVLLLMMVPSYYYRKYPPVLLAFLFFLTLATITASIIIIIFIGSQEDNIALTILATDELIFVAPDATTRTSTTAPTTTTSSISPKARAFYEQHCEMKNPSDWWPQQATNWKLRTPSFLIIGAKKAGTTTLWSWLRDQSWTTTAAATTTATARTTSNKYANAGKTPATATTSIVPASKKELLYFMPKRFPPQYWKNSSTQKVQVDSIRQVLWNVNTTNTNDGHEDGDEGPIAGRRRRKSSIHDVPPYYSAEWMKTHPQEITFEGTPDYLLFSTLSRIPILCTFPWVKILVILRNPLDRTISNHNFDQQMRMRMMMSRLATKQGLEATPPPPPPPPLDFETVLQEDWDRLNKSGVFLAYSHFHSNDDGDNDTSPFLQEEERMAWHRFQQTLARTGGASSILGRSLYVLQLEEWYGALRALGRDPTQQILVVRNEDMKSRPEWLVDQILAWLGDGLGDTSRSTAEKITSVIKKHGKRGQQQNDNATHFRSQMVTTYHAPPLANTTRDRLQQILEPYNQRLYRLLGWGPELQWSNE